MWRNTPKSGSARNPTSRLTLPFLEQCYHFEILTSINTLTCFISSSLVQLVKKKVYLYILYDLLEHYRFGRVKKFRYVTIRPFGIWQCMGIFRLSCRCLLGHSSLISNSISLKIEPLCNLCYYDDVTNFQQDLWLYGRDIALANVTHFARSVVFFSAKLPIFHLSAYPEFSRYGPQINYNAVVGV